MSIIRPFSLLIFAAIGISPTLYAQDKDKPTPIKIRAVLHDPAQPDAELFYPDPSGALLPIELRPLDLTDTLLMQPINGSLVLFDKAIIDPKKPEESLAGSIKLPADLKQAILLILPTSGGAKPHYQLLLVDDSPAKFPGGESRVLSLINFDVAIQAGEHKISCYPGAFTRVPAVTKVDEFNMAQTNFYYQRDDSWMTFTERQLQYLNASRRLFIVHATPGALQPTVTTIFDITRNQTTQ